MIVSLDDTRSNEPEDIVVPFESIPSIKYMEFNGCFLKYMNWGEENISSSQNLLNHLVHIKLSDVSFEELKVGENVLSLIRHSPNLDTIMVSASSWLPFFEPAIGVWPIGGLFDVSLNGLRHVYMVNITGKESEIEFIGMLLSKFKGIEVIDILLHCDLTDEETLRIEEQIGRFHYSSSQLSLKLKKAPPGN